MSGADATERFWHRVQKTEHCWLWTGTKLSLGYGILSVAGKSVRAHRFSYEMHRGSTTGKMVCHKCDTPLCVNPDHLFLGTAKDNTADMHAKGRFKGGQKPMTACKRGHTFTPENIYYAPDGRKRCRICMREKDRRNRKKTGEAKWHDAVAPTQRGLKNAR